MATIGITRGKTLSTTGTKSDLHDLIDLATVTISNIVNADISASAAIADTKLAQITTSDKVALSALVASGNYSPTGTWDFTGATIKVPNIVIHDYVTATAQDTTTSTSYEDVDSMTSTFTPTHASNPILIFFNGEIANTSAGANTYVILDIDGSDVSLTERNRAMPSAGDEFGAVFFHKTTLSVASHTVKVQFKVSAGTGTIEERQMLVLELLMN